MTFPGEMTRAFVGAGLQQIAEATLTIRMEFARFDDYWLPLILECLKQAGVNTFGWIGSSKA
jgi:hypothetical protein